MLPKPTNCLNKITELIKAKYTGLCGIVYCFSQFDCERAALYLRVRHEQCVNLKLKSFDANPFADLLHLCWPV